MIDRTLVTGDIMRELNCTRRQAERIMHAYGVYKPIGKRGQWFIGENEFLLRQVEGVLPEVMKKQSEAEREQYTRWKGQHLNDRRCIGCGRPLPEGETRLKCDECREYENKMHRVVTDGTFRKRYQKRKAEGKCVKCGHPLPEGWKMIRCGTCAERERNGQKKRHKARSTEAFLKGICVRCGRVNEDKRYMMCIACRMKARKEKQIYDAKRQVV